MEEARIVEIEEEEPDTPVIKHTDKSKEVKIDNSPSIKPTKETSEPSAKEEMEALAENEELIRDWLDDAA